ncbi:MAG TPA: glycosyltransferase [Luteolibacter sp.]|nr:glycosyltransferase [Luteolibacter sp.]
MNSAVRNIETSPPREREQREATRRIKVADLEMSRPLTGFTRLQGYAKMWLFLRWHGRPFAKIIVPVRGDRCTPADIVRELKDPHYKLWIREILNQGILHEVPAGEWNIARFLELVPLPQASPPTISVVVCSRDRCEDLALCLESLRKLQTKPFEILVIDNAPKTSATRELIERSYPEVRYVLEPRPGLDWARNRAIHEARGEIIAYTDDDVLVDPLWTRALAELFAADENIMAVTGLVAPCELETETQRQFEEYGGFDRGYTRKWHRVDAGETRNMARRYAGAGQFGTGANMAYRRPVFAEIGLFDPALDVGTVTNGGGDLDMFFRVLRHGHTLVYEPAAMVWHRHRRTYEKLRSQIANNGIGFYAYLVRNAMVWPDQRRGLFKLGVWWFHHWCVRRWLKSWYKPPMIPRDLITVELKGVFAGLLRYPKAKKHARRIIEEHGDHPAFVIQPPLRHDGEKRSGIAVRTLDLTSPAALIDDVAAYRSTQLFLTWNGVAVGKASIENHFRKICPERVADEITGQAMKCLMDPRGEFHESACLSEWIATLRGHVIERSVPMPPPEPPMPSVSVVIATCNRPNDLRRALVSLKRQKFPRPFEIVVADNRPDSGLTQPVVSEFEGIRLVREPRSGSSYARNAGFAAATGEIIVCTDDDLVFPPNWLENALSEFVRNDVVMVVGNVLPAEMEARSQIEFENYGGLSRGFQRRDYDRKWLDSPGHRAAPTWNIGGTANTAFRAWILGDPEIGLMHEALGPGMPSGVGEDTYFFYKALKAGHTIVYDPSSFVWHYHRATDESLDKQIYAYSKGHVAYHLVTFLSDGDARGLLYLLTTLPKHHLKKIYRRIRGSRRRAPRTILLEILGNLMGGFALWSSLRRVKKLGRSQPIHPHSPTTGTALKPS